MASDSSVLPSFSFLGFSGLGTLREGFIPEYHVLLLPAAYLGARIVSAHAEGGLNRMPILEPDFISLGAYSQGELEGPAEAKPGDLSPDCTELKQWTQR